MKIILTAGGTGGHIQPILAVVSELERIAQEKKIPLEFLWIGGKEGPEREFAQNKNIPFKGVSVGKIRRYFSWQNIVDFFKIPRGIIHAFSIVRKFKPDKVFGKGGYVSVPGILASWLLHRSIIIHESDSIPGLANRFLSHFATKIAISFEECEKYFPKGKCVLTGNPIRSEILEGSKERGFSYFKLGKDKPIIFVTGGSQGAKAINEIVEKAMPGLLKICQVIHQVGVQTSKFAPSPKRLWRVGDKIQNSKNIGYRRYGFLKSKEMVDAYAVADLVISRAGSNTLFELAALEKPSILIPLPTSAQNHQLRNARIFEESGAARVILQKDLTQQVLLKNIKDLLDNKERLEEISRNVSKLAKLDATRKIAKMIIDK